MIHMFSHRMQFTRDGMSLVVAKDDAVSILDLNGDEHRSCAISRPCAIAAFTDQAWVATGNGALVRLALDGRVLGEHSIPCDPTGRLVPTTIASPAAHWAACEPVM